LKIGLCTWFSDEVTVEEAIPLASRLGYEGIEVAGFVDALGKDWLRRWRRSLDEERLDVISVNSALPFLRDQHALNLHSVDPETRERSVGYVCDCIDLAADLSCTLVYVASVAKGTAGGPDPKTVMAECLRTCAAYAEEKGVRLAVEHFPAGALPTVADCLSLVSMTGAPNLGVLVDLGHVAITRESLDAQPALRDRLMHVHINNNDGVNDHHWPPEKGATSKEGYGRLLGSLRESGYDGYLSLEVAKVGDVEETLRTSREFVLDLLRR
jgi:sugar phosphate isomerase/epimerase